VGSTIPEVAVHRGAGDPEHLGDVGRVDSLLPHAARLGGGGVVDLAGTIPLRPFAAAAASPARVRSIMVSRSSWAKAAMIVSMGLAHPPSV
jgi:hypothetical protein